MDPGFRVHAENALEFISVLITKGFKIKIWFQVSVYSKFCLHEGLRLIYDMMCTVHNLSYDVYNVYIWK